MSFDEGKVETRREKLITLAQSLDQAARRGLFGAPIALRKATIVNGPRAGAIEIDAGMSSGQVLRTLTADDCSIVRTFIPWNFIGEPAVFMAGRSVRVEAGWPADMACDNVRLSELSLHPARSERSAGARNHDISGRWVVGPNERGQTITAGLNDDTPNWLFAGTPGSGKTTLMISAVCQLARDPANRIVLIDAKYGKSFRPLSNLRGLVGPVAVNVEMARDALMWCVGEMVTRYSGGRDPRRLIIAIDEVQELAGDPNANEALRKLVSQGRGALVNNLLATQHPTADSMGDRTIGKNIPGRMALRVIGPDASRVAVGAKAPRADHLLGHGDCYAVAPGATHRVQCAIFDGTHPTADAPDLAAWPEAEIDLPDNGNWPTGQEMGAALISSSKGEGRSLFQRVCEHEYGFKVPDNNRAVRLLKLAKEAMQFVDDNEGLVCLSESEDTLQNG